MPTVDTVLQIVPHLPGTFDGVGDYALNLAHALSAEHGITTTFLVAGKTSATSKDGYTVISGLNVGASAELARGHEHVVLHYANYGYQARGVPFLLATFVKQLRPLIPTAFAPDHLDIVGGREDPSITAAVDRLKRDLAVHHNPQVGVDLASEILRQSTFGWLDYFGAGKVWPGMLLKSTAFAAFCAHGVIPILSHREDPIAVDGDVLPGPFYVTPSAIRFPQLEELPNVRRRYY